MSSEENPKPVAPAEALPHTPAVALDSITNKEPGIMDMAKDVSDRTTGLVSEHQWLLNSGQHLVLLTSLPYLASLPSA